MREALRMGMWIWSSAASTGAATLAMPVSLGDRTRYVPAVPGIPAGRLLARRAARPPFPLAAPGTISFHRARHAIYHLACALGLRDGDAVLAPDYHSGNEIAALRAAGARVVFYRIGQDLQPDLGQIRRLLATGPRALLAIHYFGWPQPVRELADLCREREVTLIEDCALAFLSEHEGKPLGSFGDFSVYCLYKTLPLPNGGLLAQNGRRLEALDRLTQRPCGWASVLGRTAELLLERFRSRHEAAGKAFFGVKRGAGRLIRALPIRRVPVGDIGFTLADVDTAIARLSLHLAERLPQGPIRERRRENFARLRNRLRGRVPMLLDALPDGVCPLFLPILVDDKERAARALWARGVGAVQLWNEGDPEAAGDGHREAMALRARVLELPIHQDLGPEEIDYVADQVLSLGRI